MLTSVRSEESIFAEALEKGSPDERAAYLDKACGNDAALRARVENLLKSHEQAGSFLRKPPAGTVDEPQDADAPLAERPGIVIGPYKLLQQIGEGGMGTVFMAEQTVPVRRMVALKIIKPGIDSSQVIARFEAERQALALMDHPNVAKVFDAGTTLDGRPYFVMELVKGVPITRFCDESQLTPRERLELFMPVCEAVQHAHQKGIIHRDLKSSNVLVALYDDRAVPKVIDFGVAKATGEKLTERTLFTMFGSLIGTLEYMSPEQAKLNALDIDTRSDVYALGVLLYELLTGSTPLERARLKEVALDELLRLIREEEPPKPSTRLSHSGEALATISSRRGTEPARLCKALRGELDWIVMKALEKDRARRYETASGLARDIQHYLADEPVEACPPSASYRLRKLARKYKKPLAAVAAFALLLVVSVMVSSGLAVRAMRAETAARTAQDQATKERDRARDAEQRANAEKEGAQATLRFLLADVLQQADRFREPKGALTIRALLDQAAVRLEGNKGMPPLVEAAIHQAIGRSYRGLGLFDKAEHHQARAYELRRDHAGEDDPATLEAAYELSEMYTLQSDFSKAEPLALRVLEARRRLFGEDHPETVRAMNALASIYYFRDEPCRAEPLYAQALQASRRHSERDLDTLQLTFQRGTLYMSLGRYAEAEPLLDQALEGLKAVLTDRHPLTLLPKFCRIPLLLAASQLDKAEREAQENCRLTQEVLGEMNPLTLNSKGLLARVYVAQGRRSEAEPLLHEFREKAEGQKDRLAPFVIFTLRDIGHDLVRQHEFNEAESFLGLYLAIAEKKLPNSWQRYSAVSALGACRLGQKKFTEAEELLLKGYAGLWQYKDSIPTSFRQNRLAEALKRLVQLYDETGKPDEAAKWRSLLTDWAPAA